MTTPYEQVRQVAQVLLKSAPRPLPDGCIREQVEQARKLVPLDDEDRDRLVRELETLFNVTIGIGAILVDQAGHEPWLETRHAEIEAATGWRYWKRYARLLEEEANWPPKVIDRTDKLIEEVLGWIEYPARPGAWDRRGLICGNVQSGKTAHYTGLICKAADAGYKLIVVLAGGHDNLRSQTQLRLDEGFLGYESSQIFQEGGMKLVGVGNLDPSCPAPDTITNSSQNGDFNRAVADRFKIQPGGKPLLFVVKKNAGVLKNLLRWVEFYATPGAEGRKLVRGVPLIVIDDEADYASVDTGVGNINEDGKPDPDHDPKAINGLIRKLLYHFEQTAYIGYTATPFANIFIHEKGKTAKHGEDLFPRSFIKNMPAPSNYVGPARVFGHDADPEAGLEEREPLPIIRPIADYQGWVPDKHKNGHVPGELPDTLKEAIRAFVLVCAARRARGQAMKHSSMLVHVTKFTNVQETISRQIAEEMTWIEQVLRRGQGAAGEALMPQLKALWERDFEPTTDRMNATRLSGEDEYQALVWEEVEAHLQDAARWIKVRVVNGMAGDILDYSANASQGLSVIAIGGDKLSRGLTLEGLSVSYYLRSTKMYDTLMQMGRWFGYRPGYLDLCRLYTTDELIGWYEHISIASEELRSRFDEMALARSTPEQYGHRVRCHPDLLITSGVKMRHGVQMELTYSGGISETISLFRDRPTLARNRSAVEDFVASLGKPRERTDKKPLATLIWDGVPTERVLDDFLGRFRVPNDVDKVRIPLIRSYIQNCLREDELTEWTVALISSSQKEAEQREIGGHRVGLIKRQHIGQDFKADDERARYTIRRLVSPSDETLDMTKADIAAALDATRQAWGADPNRSADGKKEPDVPGGVQIRDRRPVTRGLLLIYPLEPGPAAVEEIPIGFAISFPGGSRTERLRYRVNNVYFAQEFGGEE
ncbi:Z1 domain-containing protein [Planctomyces sp. SH-PL62]|uniref:Z1 domain-containing protein n=1 Tax=Planctomyces sp. SH-PL62 TaxID=1636152 RepID=UPI00078E15CE|nr:Z1 domain-containing protein [Planctomyces sp. SH-PL62]AMV40490.1 Z1 domain protein [Planctomyces sp. SH-PL62]